jgi:GntR family transcriptional regulator, arabinose operon transcriptional repressor
VVNSGGGDRQVPAYVRVKRALLELVEAGDHPTDAPFITERKVCERFGVSTTTAVRALNELVAEGVLVRRQGRGTFVAERGSGAAASGRDGAAAESRSVACIVQGHGPHVAELVSGVSAMLAGLGYRMFLTHCDDDAEREGAALRQALDSRVQGVILYPVQGRANAGALAEAQRRGIPIVLVDRYHQDVATDAVLADNVAVGYEVTRELIRLGHQRIATLWAETDCTSVRDRLSGHVQALREQGIAVRPGLTVLRHYARRQSPSRTEVLRQLLAGAEPPTVMLCANGYVLAQVAEDLVSLGIDIPGRVDLAGMDQAGPFDILPLTAVAASLPSRRMGEEAANLLHARIAEPDPYRDVQHLVLPISIRTRDSAPGHLRLIPTE